MREAEGPAEAEAGGAVVKSRSQGTVNQFEPKRTIESVRWPLTAAEIRQLGADLAHQTRECIRIESDKKVATAALASAKKEAEARCADLSLKIQNGYEMRDTECLVYFSVPQPGIKRIVRADDPDSIVREEPMTAAEMQAAFDFPSDGGSKPH